MDPDVQEIWDTAKKLSCIWTSRFPKKEIKFNPFEVSMLEVVSMNYQGDEINCWMDIQKGVYPQTSAITDSVEIGDKISMMIFLQDTEDKADIGVRDCWAFTGESFEDESSSRVQLTSSSGCILRPKLMGPWKKTRTLINSRDTLVAHSAISAFKFPDQRQIHLMCNAEVCYGQCQQCDENENAEQQHQKSSGDDIVDFEVLEEVSQQDIPSSLIYEDENSKSMNDVPENSNQILEINKKFPIIDVQDVREEEELFSHNDENPQKNTEQSVAFTGDGPESGSTDNVSSDQNDCSGLENCELSPDLVAKEGDDTPSVPKPSVVSILNCFPGSQNILCQSIIDKPEVVIDRCSPGSTDPRCSWTIKHFDEIDCTKYNDHPHCLTLQDAPPVEETNDGSLDCVEGSTNPNCLTLSQEIDCDINSDSLNCKSFQDASPTTESTQISQCTEDSNNPSCLSEASQIEPSSCSGDTSDPNCSSDISQTNVSSAPQCNSESNDPNCTEELQTVVEEQDICTLEPGNPSCAVQTEDFLITNEMANECSEGSENPECIDKSLNVNICDPSSTDPTCNVVPTSNTEETEAYDCINDSNDPRCTNKPSGEIDCSIQSDDPQCNESISTIDSNAENIECQGDSTNINCIDQSTADLQCDLNSNDPNCQSQSQDTPSSDLSQCTEGSTDLNCLQDNSEVNCSIYPDNPLCQIENSAPPIDQTREEFVCDENSLDERCQQDSVNIKCDSLSTDANCQEATSLQDICFPGSKDVRCRSESTSSNSESHENQEPDRKPKPTLIKMDKKDDFHGDKNPRYHAFHSWLYQRVIKPRSRGKRSFLIPSEKVLRNPKFNSIGSLLNKSRTITLTNHSDSENKFNDDKYKSKEYILNVNTVFEEIPGNEEDSYSIIKEKIDFSDYGRARKQLLIFTLSFCCIFSFFILINFYLCKVQVENRAFNV